MELKNKKIGIIGAGTWGTAMGSILASSEVGTVTVWTPTGRNIESLRQGKHPNLSGRSLPKTLRFTTDAIETVNDADVLILAVSSNYLRPTLEKIRSLIKPEQTIVSIIKGLEAKTLKVPSQIIDEFLPNNPVVVLTGPSHAEEVIKGFPFGLQMASTSTTAMDLVDEIFTNCNVFLPRTDDVKGAELGGALKNIVAIGFGIGSAMNLGANFNSLLASSGMKEILMLAMSFGARTETLMGLSGFGDLLTTIGSGFSRNRKFGELIGQGHSYESAVKEVGMVVEGLNALDGALELAKKHNLKMPVIQLVKDVVTSKKPVSEFKNLVPHLRQWQ